MDENNEGSKNGKELLFDLMKDILSAKPQEHELVVEFDRLYQEFVDFADKENAMPGKIKQSHNDLL
jgi:hypothetical protein